ncbi:MAG TPA: hypothetical protein VFS21_21270 [Roseiflexaceae bacterium]|nr:hypothetical protein [Roseiflexaceae bacterium]
MRSQRLFAVLFLAALLLNFPLLALARDGALFGIPLLFLYLFAAWALCIGLAALIVRGQK